MQWSPEDRSKVVAHILEQTSRCDLCGTADWEWENNKFAYTPVDEFCRGCYLKSVFGDQESNSNLPGTNVKLVPTTKMLSAQSKMKAIRAARARKARRETENG